MLESEWKQRTVLPAPRISPPPNSSPKEHAESTTNAPAAKPSKARSPPKPSTATPAQNVLQSTASQSDMLPSGDKSPERQPSPDMDVDVGGTPEPENMLNDTARDGESDEIIRQLEKGLPRWEGFGDVGWMEEVDPVSEALWEPFVCSKHHQDRHLQIVLAISGYKDAR